LFVFCPGVRVILFVFLEKITKQAATIFRMVVFSINVKLAGFL